MSPLDEPLHVLAQYPGEFPRDQVHPLGTAGGLSGALFWRIEGREGPLCLRRWPSGHPSEEGLPFLHAVLRHVAPQGLDFVPVPLADREGRTFVRHAGHLWELTPWMPGRADFRDDPRASRLQAAMAALARFHQAAATFPSRQPRQGPSPGIAQRIEIARRFAQGDLEELCRRLAVPPRLDFHDRAWRLMTLARIALEPVLAMLQRASTIQVPLQPCICDVWHDHVLFTGERVTGLVDFGAMRVESVAIDVARLLGSMAGDNEALWRVGLDAYHAVRPLSDDERALVGPLDSSGVLLPALNWVDWLYRQHRQFPDPRAVARRLDEILPRLETLAASLLSPADNPTPLRLWLPHESQEPRATPENGADSSSK
jgi:Ser/Thr protein kinase RdoA (MazF antagonist)